MGWRTVRGQSTVRRYSRASRRVFPGSSPYRPRTKNHGAPRGPSTSTEALSRSGSSPAARGCRRTRTVTSVRRSVAPGPGMSASYFPGVSAARSSAQESPRVRSLGVSAPGSARVPTMSVTIQWWGDMVSAWSRRWISHTPFLGKSVWGCGLMVCGLEFGRQRREADILGCRPWDRAPLARMGKSMVSSMPAARGPRKSCHPVGKKRGKAQIHHRPGPQ